MVSFHTKPISGFIIKESAISISQPSAIEFFFQALERIAQALEISPENLDMTP
jgi:hypothetical protein